MFPAYVRLLIYSIYVVLNGKSLENQIKACEADNLQVTVRPGSGLGIRVKGRNQPRLLLGLHLRDKVKPHWDGERPFEQRFPEPFQRPNSLPLPCRGRWQGREQWVRDEENVKWLWVRGHTSTSLQHVMPSCMTPEQLGEETGRGLRKEVISLLVTDIVGIYRFKTKAPSM